MTVTAQATRNRSVAAGGATVFPYSFKIAAASDLLVQVNGVTKTLGVDYTVSGVGVGTGGNVTFVTPMVGGELVVRKRAMAIQRATDYQTLGDLRAVTLNADLDAAVLMVQQLNELLGRCLAANEQDDTSAFNYDAGGRRITNAGLATGLNDVTTYTQVVSMINGGLPLFAGTYFSANVERSADTSGFMAQVWQVALTAGKRYRIRIIGSAQNTAAGAYGFRLRQYSSGGLAGTTNGRAMYRDQADSAMKAVRISMVDGSANAGFDYSPTTINQPVPFDVEFIFNCTTSGTMEFRFGNTTNNGAHIARLDIGTLFTVEELATL